MRTHSTAATEAASAPNSPDRRRLDFVHREIVLLTFLIGAAGGRGASPYRRFSASGHR